MKIDKQQATDKWDKCKPIENAKLASTLQKRFDNADQPNENFETAANEILIAAEFLTGQATPDEFKEQRLSYQVNELSKRMGGEEKMDSIDKAKQLLNDWFILNGANKGFIKKNNTRINKNIKALLDMLKV